MSQFAMPPPPPRKPTNFTLHRAPSPEERKYENHPENLQILQEENEINSSKLQSDECYEENPQNQDFNLASLSEELQQAYRWGKLAFETQNDVRNGDGDPLALDAFERCSLGLISVATKLVDRERLGCLMRDQGLFPPSIHGNSSPSSPIADDFNSPFVQNENESLGRENPKDDKPKQLIHSDDTYQDLKQYVTNQSDLPRFADIASLDNPKKILREAVIFPLVHPHLFKGVRQPWKGILLHGPPGTGKTELAKATAGECEASFVLISPSTLLSKFVGESERMMARVFEFAKAIAPTVLFFDEIDALGLSRGADGSDQGLRRLMAELLVQFNLLKASHRVTILAATNRIEDIDCALLRRFERRIEVGLLPDSERAKLIQLKMNGTEIQQDVDFLKISHETEGYSGADLELLCREAAMCGVRELMHNEDLLRSGCLSIRPVTLEDFMLALQVIFPSSRPHSGTSMTTHDSFGDNGRRRKRSAESRSGQQTPQFGSSDIALGAKSHLT